MDGLFYYHRFLYYYPMAPYIYYGTTFNTSDITPENVLAAYTKGIFPMGDDNDTISWFDHEPRAVIPFGKSETGLKISRSLKQILNKNTFIVKTDTAFTDVINACSVSHGTTWINGKMIELYTELHKLGFAHSVEAWQDGKLAGGLYGIAYKSAFFGESMFHNVSNASKAAVVKLYETLSANNFVLFDIQMMTPLFKSLGAIEISKQKYRELLKKSITI